MINPSEAVSGIDKLSKTVQKNPFGFVILLMGLFVGGCAWYVIRKDTQNSDSLKACNEEMRLMQREKDNLYLRLLEKNKIIDRYEEVVEIVDSALQKTNR